MASLVPVSPLAAINNSDPVSFQGEAITFSEVDDYGLIRVQVFSRGAENAETISAKLGITCPGPQQVTLFSDGYIFWAAPGEWIVAVDTGSESLQAERIATQLKGILSTVVVMTDSRIVIRLSGSEIRNFLAKGSSVDFDPSMFTVGSCVITKFAQIPAMIVQPSEREEFLLFADRSVAVYLWEWLVDAAQEFGVLVE